MSNEQFYVTRETGQIIVEGDAMRIGVGNLLDKPTDEAGPNTERQVTTGLWLFFRDNPDAEQAVRLAQGQSVHVEGYTIRVVEINFDERMVVVGVTPPSDKSTSAS